MGSNILGFIALKHTIICGFVLAIAIYVVDFTMLNLEGVLGILNRLEGLKIVHGHVISWLLKHRGLVHVIPSPDVGGRAFVLIISILRSPVISGFFIKIINVDTFSRPALTNKSLIILGLNAEVIGNSFLIDVVLIINLDMGISNGNELTSISSNGSMHGRDIRIVFLIPSEISAAISVINVQSDSITRDFIGIETLVDA
jgi:hypothetical protein